MKIQNRYWGAVLALMALVLVQACDEDPTGPKAGRLGQPAGEEQIIVQPAALELTIGAKVQLRARMDDEYLAPTAVVWTSDNPAVALITPDGIVEGLAEGSVTIEAEYGAALGRARVSVATRGGQAGDGSGEVREKHFRDDERER
jgi:hypothetical protein